MNLDLAHFNIACNIQKHLTPDDANLFARALRLDMPAVAEFAARAYDADTNEMLDAVEFIEAVYTLRSIPA